MYPHKGLTQRNRSTRCIQAITGIQVVSMCAMLLLVSTTAAETTFQQGSNKQAAIYFQTGKAAKDKTLLDHIPQELYLSNTHVDQIAFAGDKDLPFNYLWMRQYQDDYRYRDGGAAAGKLLRMTIRSLYEASRTKTNSYSSNRIAEEDSFGNFIDNELDYKLRIRSGRIKIGVEYQF